MIPEMDKIAEDLEAPVGKFLARIFCGAGS